MDGSSGVEVIWRAPTDLGATLPVLFGLADSFAERRQRDLYEQAVAQALAHHAPQDVSSLLDGEHDAPDEESDFVTPEWAKQGGSTGG